MSTRWKFCVVGLIVIVIFLVVLAERQLDELRDVQRRVANLEQQVK